MLASNDSSIMMLGVTFQRRLDGSFDGNARFDSLSHRHGFVLLSRFMGKDSSLSRLICKDSLLLTFTSKVFLMLASNDSLIMLLGGDRFVTVGARERSKCLERFVLP